MSFGNPSAADGSPEAGGGFGGGSAADGTPSGDSFGTKSDSLSPVYLFEHGELGTVGDGGGEIVYVRFDQAQIEDFSVFRIRIRGQNPELLCYSGNPGEGTSLPVAFGGRALSFATPRLPVGSYQLDLIREGGEDLEIGGDLKVIRRLRSGSSLSLKGRLPEFMDAGARSFRILEDFSGDSNDETYSQLDLLLSTLGEQFDTVNGVLLTRSLSDFGVTATQIDVESTLNFPSTGYIWIGKGIYRYTGKTDTSFTGLTLSRGTREVISEKSEVQYAEEYIAN